VEEFIFLVDFVVLETEVIVCRKNETPMILGWLFHAASNEFITYQDEKLKLRI